MSNIFNNYDFRAILAMDGNCCIGKDDGLPWHHEPQDMKRFRDLTTGHAVLMGKKTWDSLPEDYRPLPNRTNIVLTNNPKDVVGLGNNNFAIPSVEMLKHYVATGTKLFLIGGANMYDQFIQYARIVHLTHFNHVFDGDVVLSKKVQSMLDEAYVLGGSSNLMFSDYGYSIDFMDVSFSSDVR